MARTPTRPGANAFVTTAKSGPKESSSDDVISAVNSLDINSLSRPIEEGAIGHNRWLLGAGAHGGAVIRGAGVGAIQGASLMSGVRGAIKCTNNSMTVFSGLEFTPNTSSENPLIVVDSGAEVCILGCVFSVSRSSTNSMITIADRGKATILSCVFSGMGPSTNPVIANAGAPGNVQVGFCHNKTGNSLFVPAVAQVWVLTITNAGAAGNLHGVTLNGGTVASRATVGGDTVTNVRDGLFTQLQRNTYPPIGVADSRVQMKASGVAAIEFTALDAGTSFTIGSTSTGTAASTAVNTVPNTVAGAIGMGNI